LRAKVDKMTAELKEYKQAAVSRQTGNPLMPMLSTYQKASQAPHNPNDVNFSFEFPKFGQLPGPPVLSKHSKSTTSPGEAPSRSTSFTSNLSPLDSGSHNSLSFGSNQNLANTNQSNYSGLYNGAALEGMTNGNFDYMLHHNKGSASSADSGSGPTSTGHNTSHSSPASSNSHHGTSSSCGTSPEPYTQSPPASKTDAAAAAAAATTTLSTIGEESHSADPAIDSQSSFCSKLSQVCGSASQPIPRTMTSPPLAPSTAAPTPAASTSNSSFDINSLDWLAAQNGNQFDPQLFGDYREPHDNILTGLYDDSFFSEAFAIPGEFGGSPFTLDATPQAQQTQHTQTTVTQQHHQQGGKKDLIGEIDAQLGEEEVVPAESEMLTCTNMWYVYFFPLLPPPLPSSSLQPRKNAED
jgi:AP-1-like factor